MCRLISLKNISVHVIPFITYVQQLCFLNLSINTFIAFCTQFTMGLNLKFVISEEDIALETLVGYKLQPFGFGVLSRIGNTHCTLDLVPIPRNSTDQSALSTVITTNQPELS